MPLANGKVSDLSYFKQKKEATPETPPPPLEFKHKIGEATFPLDELKGALTLAAAATSPAWGV